METIVKEVVKKLKNEINIPVFHQFSPNNKVYPNIIYTVVSDVPALHGDNKELSSNITIRIHIITKDGNYYAIKKQINKIMLDLGFSRGQAVEVTDQGYKIATLDYKIGVINNDNN
ncbi:hypothetical protein [Anaerovibrio sp. JC8]|uniref:hypothetical protein n=1 Tax=Anaerovibrio sp. JC8 TaxID=1240085 RepID=UPI000A101DA0|nr:hypothetical protein [Anaerovibrio sp. JC8]